MMLIDLIVYCCIINIYIDPQQSFYMNHPQTYMESPIKINSILNRQTSPHPFKIGKPIKNDIFLPNQHQKDLMQILQLKKKGRLHESLIKIEAAIENYPSQMRFYQIKGQIAFTLKRYEDSINCYNRLLQVQESIQNPQQNSHSLYYNQTDHSKIMSLYHFNRGLCLQKLGRHSEAITAFKQATMLNKQNIDFYLSLAESYHWIGKPDKMMQIFEKLTDKLKKNVDVFMKVIDFFTKIKNFQAVIKFILKGQAQNMFQDQDKTFLSKMLSSKANSLRRLSKYQFAIEAYRKMLDITQQRQIRLNTYFSLAFCYQKCMNLIESIKCYKHIIEMDKDNIQAINNIANLYLRLQKYSQALSILNWGLQSCKISNNINKVKLLLLRSHRIITFMKLGQLQDAEKDLGQIIQSIKGWECLQMKDTSQWENYKFIKGVIGKYTSSFDKLSELYRQISKPQISMKYNDEMKDISIKLMNSISLQLQSKVSDPCDQLERLSQRINNLYKEIIDFKSTTLKDQEISHLRVHTKIQEIEEILCKKQEQTNKLASQMEELKRQYSDVYNIVQEIKASDKNSNLSRTIRQLKSNGKELIASYVQELYWVFSAYIISIRLVANHLVSQGKNLVHTSGISSFFSRFKGIFEAASHIPHIGSICAAINSLLSLYLSQQSHSIYQILNRIITKTFTNEHDLQKSLENAIQSLAKTDYILVTLQKCKLDKIRSEMSLYNRAHVWFKKQKCKAIQKIININELCDSPDELLIKEQVIEDIGSILLYLIRNQDCVNVRQGQFFKNAFSKALLQNFKTKQISSLYQKHQQKQVQLDRSREGGCSSKCQIY